MKESEKLKAEAEALRRELVALKQREQVICRRINEIFPGPYGAPGLYAKAAMQERNESFPVYDVRGLGNCYVRRIVDVSGKFITLRSDDDDDADVQNYNAVTGIRSRCKTDCDRIDVAKAMEIWNNHQQSKK